MRVNTRDETLKKNYIQKYQFLVAEYELVKQKIHPKYRLAKEFYEAHNTCAQNFLKYYGRYKQGGGEAALLPQKRGPRFVTRRAPQEIEERVLEYRDKGCNKYEICALMKQQLGEKKLSPGGEETD